MKCAEAEHTVATCFSPFILWPFEEQDEDYRASWTPNPSSGALPTPGSTPGDRTAVILGGEPEKP